MPWPRRVLASLTLLLAALWLTTAAASAQSLGPSGVQAPASVPKAPQAVSQAVQAAQPAVQAARQSVAQTAPAAQAATQAVTQTAQRTTATVSQAVKSASAPVSVPAPAVVAPSVPKLPVQPPAPPSVPVEVPAPALPPVQPLPVEPLRVVAEVASTADVVTQVQETVETANSVESVAVSQLQAEVDDVALLSEAESQPLLRAESVLRAESASVEAQPAVETAARQATATAVQRTQAFVEAAPLAAEEDLIESQSVSDLPAPVAPTSLEVIDLHDRERAEAPAALQPILESASQPEPSVDVERVEVPAPVAEDLAPTTSTTTLDGRATRGIGAIDDPVSAPQEPFVPALPLTAAPGAPGLSSSAADGWLTLTSVASPRDTWRTLRNYLLAAPQVIVLPNLAPPG